MEGWLGKAWLQSGKILSRCFDLQRHRDNGYVVDVGTDTVHAVGRRRNQNVVYTRSASNANDQVDGFVAAYAQERVCPADRLRRILIPTRT